MSFRSHKGPNSNKAPAEGFQKTRGPKAAARDYYQPGGPEPRCLRPTRARSRENTGQRRVGTTDSTEHRPVLRTRVIAMKRNIPNISDTNNDPIQEANHVRTG